MLTSPSDWEDFRATFPLSPNLTMEECEPLRYPCVLVYHQIVHGAKEPFMFIYYAFVYQEDMTHD